MVVVVAAGMGKKLSADVSLAQRSYYVLSMNVSILISSLIVYISSTAPFIDR